VKRVRSILVAAIALAGAGLTGVSPAAAGGAEEADHLLTGVGQRGIAVKRIVRFVTKATVP